MRRKINEYPLRSYRRVSGETYVVHATFNKEVLRQAHGGVYLLDWDMESLMQDRTFYPGAIVKKKSKSDKWHLLLPVASDATREKPDSLPAHLVLQL